jgi:hypothetical protein
VGAGGVALFLAIVTAFTLLGRPRPIPAVSDFGLDFIAFYTGGSFVNDGRHRELFDLRPVKAFQDELARQHGVDLGPALGPWWNPPFYAWSFAPLAKLPYPIAAKVWIGINVACVAAACWLMRRMLPKDASWKTWALIPVLVALSTPFIHCVTHGQNTGTSLLLVTLLVTAWRSGRAFTAGMLAGLLFYKPQLAVVLSAVLVLSLGRRALLGLCVTGACLLLVTLVTMPGALGEFLRQMPLNLRQVQEQHVYLWERHATFKAFWRLLIQGRAVGAASGWVTALAAVCMAAVGAALALVMARTWRNPFRPLQDDDVEPSRGRLIAATIAATPLLMPFYFDYDLLLLAVPAVLLAGEILRQKGVANAPLPAVDRWLMLAWSALYVWLMVNADVAEHTRVNLAVPLLAAVAGLSIARALRREADAAVETPQAPPMARAA